MENCLIDCRFDGAWVLQESKKNILPVDVLLDDLRRGVDAARHFKETSRRRLQERLRR